MRTPVSHFAIAAGLAAASVVPVWSSQPTAADAYVLPGPIGQETADRLLREMDGADASRKWLVVDSPGGDVEAAIRIAHVMHDRRISLYVSGMCASSCANYLFPAAEFKVLAPGAIVGWHGSPAGPVSGLENLSPEQLARVQALRNRLVEAERNLFRTLGVDVRLLCAGDRTMEQAHAYGWTMPVRSMAQFGIRSVFAVDPQVIPSHVPRGTEAFVTIEPARDCSRVYKHLVSATY